MQPPPSSSPPPSRTETQGEAEQQDAYPVSPAIGESLHSPSTPPGALLLPPAPVDVPVDTTLIDSTKASDATSFARPPAEDLVIAPTNPTPFESVSGESATVPAVQPTYEGESALPFAPLAPLAPFSLAELPTQVQTPTNSRRVTGAFILLIGVSTICAVLCALLGYVSRNLAAQNQLSFELFTLDGLRFWLPGLALALLTGVAVFLVAGRRPSPGLSPSTAWIFPFVTMGAGLLVVSVYHDRTWWFVAPVVTWFALIVGTIARLHLTEPSGTGHDIAVTMLTVITYVVAFLSLSMIYINKLRSIFSATAVVVVCVLLLLQITDGATASLPRRLVYAFTGGLIIGQVTWVINYWSAAGWIGGVFLLAVFYLIAGLSAAQLRDRIGLFDVLEFGGIALIALVIVSAAVLYQS